ncbi:MAG: DUF2249 domain-containing protein [Gammaproteobacteria bacterium]|nr:DUF2249 domain-containing protein [Gammaproteobacteria bacterium]MBU6508921.1 DUF2249 domain-containing protein [Gammaproteobacteria bacterium]MDE1983351.1 DUF2249 domain-containing protein [Gammaproteobacteria bacterium]MDE2108103.1 DUF2249 domain-containing protein [Gammaproteobacteria bacterium]MDE2461527.1 DUF2249 domain-containing protein [Gammaproteobacteria bacterium]
MASIEALTLDVREELRKGGEPLPLILGAVEVLKPGQSLRLLTTFEPLPLYAVLARKGFAHSARHLGEGDWEVLFTPGAANPQAKADQPKSATAGTSTAGWPAPSARLDNRGLQPPEPLVRILDALEHLGPGEVLEAINERDPVFLYPELEARGAAIHTDKQADGVHLLIRHAK